MKNIDKLTQEYKAGKLSYNEFIYKCIDYSICKNHTGKMTGLWSISTSVLLNPNCRKNREIPGSICSHCFAAAQCEYQKTTRNKLAQNTDFYTTYEIPAEAVPFLNCLYFRFESFGDLNNPLQFKNYMTIAKKNPNTKFAIWTKNPHIIRTALQIYGNIIPKNVEVIYSSLFIDKQTELEKIKKAYPFITKTFTVYSSPDAAAENGKKVNCGGLSCRNCKFECYKKQKNPEKNERIEVLK